MADTNVPLGDSSGASRGPSDAAAGRLLLAAPSSGGTD